MRSIVIPPRDTGMFRSSSNKVCVVLLIMLILDHKLD